MAFKIFVTELANEDLAGLVRFIASDNPQAAERFGSALIDKLKLLGDHPELGRIVYRIRKREQTVEILRFWHAARGEPRLGE